MAQLAKTFYPYDPLPAQDLNDMVGFMNGIAAGTNLEPASVKAPNIDFTTLKTTEQIVGEHTNGKTIYRKTFTGGITHAANTRNFLALNPDSGAMQEVLAVSGYFVISASGEALQVGHYGAGDTGGSPYAFSYVNFNSTILNFITRSATARSNAPYCITVDYTKA